MNISVLQSELNNRKIVLLVLFCLTLLFVQGCQSNNANRNHTVSDQFNQLMAEIWQYQVARSPQSAHYNGSQDYQHLLNDMSVEALAKDNQKLKAYVNQLNKLDRTQLTNQDIINLDILKRQLNDHIDRYHYKAHYTPYTAESGFHASLAFLPRASNFKKAKDFEDYISRLKAFPTYFAQQTYWLKQGLKQGITHPKAVMAGYEQGIKTFIVTNPQDSVFYSPVKSDKHATLNDAQYQTYQQIIAQLIKEVVTPEYQKYHDFMVNDYIPNMRNTIGIADIPNGRDFYFNRAKYYTTTEHTPEQIHQIGLDEVARIKAQMQQIINKLAFKGSFADFIHFLRTDPQFYATSAEQLLKEAAYISKKMDAKLPTLFNYLPRIPYGVAPVPDHLAPKYTTGRYLGPSKDDQPGYYWVNTYALNTRPLYELEALTLHEAVPGHHLQKSINLELTDLPPHRRYSYISAFGEGWGLYAEFLGIEAGFYQDPYSDFGRLTYEMWRACRLVVDTGMHVMGWSKEQAIDFLASNTALSTHNVRTEIDRYITWPGQALSYKMGELTIKRLRKRTEQALGEKFDIKEFHRQVLRHGSVPLKVLEQQIENYISQQLKRS